MLVTFFGTCCLQCPLLLYLSRCLRVQQHSVDPKSAVFQHQQQQHNVNFQNTRVVSKERITRKRKIKEAIEISRTTCFNGCIGLRLSPIWASVLWFTLCSSSWPDLVVLSLHVIHNMFCLLNNSFHFLFCIMLGCSATFLVFTCICFIILLCILAWRRCVNVPKRCK